MTRDEQLDALRQRVSQLEVDNIQLAQDAEDFASQVTQLECLAKDAHKALSWALQLEPRPVNLPDAQFARKVLKRLKMETETTDEQ